MDRIGLFQVIRQSFDGTELQQLCFELGVDYEDIEGGTVPKKAIELVGYFERRGELARLEQACRIVRPGQFPGTVQPARYRSEVEFSLDSVNDALAAIGKLSLPETWPDLAVTRPLCNGGWMGSDSEALVGILYALYRPLVLSQLSRNEVERNFSLLDWRTRLQFLLLDWAAQAVVHDLTIAALTPAIPYTPRVPGWRRLREQKPRQYWWQGLSHDKFEKAVGAFCRTAESGPRRIVTLPEFRQYYRDVFGSTNEADQQAIGLAANALYGFTPAERPVFWRMLIIQAVLYRGILGCRSSSRRPTRIAELTDLFAAADGSACPFAGVHKAVEGFEPFAVTLQAAMEFLNLLVLPPTLLELSASEFAE